MTNVTKVPKATSFFLRLNPAFATLLSVAVGVGAGWLTYRGLMLVGWLTFSLAYPLIVCGIDLKRGKILGLLANTCMSITIGLLNFLDYTLQDLNQQRSFGPAAVVHCSLWVASILIVLTVAQVYQWQQVRGKKLMKK